MSQPAVSQTIAKLEELYGGDLFERRRGAPVALTSMGRVILPKAKLLLFLVDTQIGNALATAQSMAGSPTIGFLRALLTGLLYQAALRLTHVRDSQADETLNLWRPAIGGRDHGIGDMLAGGF